MKNLLHLCYKIIYFVLIYPLHNQLQPPFLRTFFLVITILLLSEYAQAQADPYELTRLEATVIRANVANPLIPKKLPLTDVPRLQNGDVLEIKIMPSGDGKDLFKRGKAKWDLMVAFINLQTVSAESLLKKENVRKLKKETLSNTESFNVTCEECIPLIFFINKAEKSRFPLAGEEDYREQINNWLKIDAATERINELATKTEEIAGGYSRLGLFLGSVKQALEETNAQPATQQSTILDKRIDQFSKIFKIKLPDGWQNEKDKTKKITFVTQTALFQVVNEDG